MDGARGRASGDADKGRLVMMDLKGIAVVALEKTVAAPYASTRLADAGAQVIKIERAEGGILRGDMIHLSMVTAPISSG